MSLTDEEENRLVHLLSALEENSKLLSDWERSFVADQVKRFEEYKSNIRLSGKQWAVLQRVYDEKIENAR